MNEISEERKKLLEEIVEFAPAKLGARFVDDVYMDGMLVGNAYVRFATCGDSDEDFDLCSSDRMQGEHLMEMLDSIERVVSRVWLCSPIKGSETYMCRVQLEGRHLDFIGEDRSWAIARAFVGVHRLLKEEEFFDPLAEIEIPHIPLPKDARDITLTFDSEAPSIADPTPFLDDEGKA